MRLNLIHLRKRTVELFNPFERIARCTRMICRTESRKFRIVFYYHVGIRSETAGRDDDRFRTDFIVAVRRRDGNSCGRSVFRKDVGHFVVETDISSLLLCRSV